MGEHILRYIRVILPFFVFALLIRPSFAADEIEVNERQKTMPRKILFDTDPGGDDIFALFWLQSLAKQGHAEIVAVTTVAGNVDSEQTFVNASKTLALGGLHKTEVGRSAIVHSPNVDASQIHGTDGMGNLSQTLPAAPHRLTDARSAVDIIVEKLKAQPNEITLVAVGPLTNLAAAEQASPGILSKAKEVVIMGGAFRHGGNITSQAEFNIYCDPEAAEKVLGSRDDIVILPLDVTTQITFTKEHAAAIDREAPSSAIASFLVDLTRFMTKTTMGYRATEGVAGFHVHDAATLAYLFHPETLLLRRAKVQVETKGQWTQGRTLFDERHGAKMESNAWVALEVDAVNLLAILVEDFKLLCATE
jgi:inosine-uridine nucleoside N-ribohydrolase